MTEVRCPMCSKPNAEDAEICEFCGARITPLVVGSSAEETQDNVGSADTGEDISPSPKGNDWLSRMRNQTQSDEEVLDEDSPTDLARGSTDLLGRLEGLGLNETQDDSADQDFALDEPLEEPIDDFEEPVASETFEEPFEEKLFCESSLLRNRMMNEMFHEVIPVILHEDDLNSMLFSIENRSPYLDSRLFEFAFSIPNEHLMHDGYAKYILRESVKGILNEKVRADRQKKGFNASFNSLVNLNDPVNQDYILSDGPIFDLFKRDKMRDVLNQLNVKQLIMVSHEQKIEGFVDNDISCFNFT